MKKILPIILILSFLAGCGPSKPDISSASSSSSSYGIFLPQAKIDELTSKWYSIQNTYKWNINKDWNIFITNLALLSKGGDDNQYILSSYASWSTNVETVSWSWKIENDKTLDWKVNIEKITLLDSSNNPTNWFRKQSTFLMPLDKDWKQLTGWNLILLK